MNNGITLIVVQVKSGARELGGIYSCIVALDSSEVSVLIFGESFLSFSV